MIKISHEEGNIIDLLTGKQAEEVFETLTSILSPRSSNTPNVEPNAGIAQW